MTNFKLDGVHTAVEKVPCQRHIRHILLTLFLASCSAVFWGQKAMDLEGMLEVAEHYGMDESQLEAEWPQHIADAVLVSYGWHKVSQLKSNALIDHSFQFQEDEVISSLLRKEVVPKETVVFYPCEDGTYIQVVSMGTFDKSIGRYALNAKAFLKK